MHQSCRLAEVAPERAPLYVAAALLDEGVTTLRERYGRAASNTARTSALHVSSREPLEARVKRVIVVVLDGLRPDAIDAFGLTHFRALTALGAFTPNALTVSPSVTAAAMTSLFTGAPPLDHGLISDRFHLPRSRVALDPLPRVLGRAGLPVTTFVGALPVLFRPLAHACAKYLRVRRPTFRGSDAKSILAAAHDTLSRQRDGLILLHWPDADSAGHEHGWMSPEYGTACRALDDALGALVRASGVPDDPETLLIALADHGGGGCEYRDHAGDHPDNLTIPILIAGGRVDQRRLEGPVHILDVPPTVARALGVAAPVAWPGRVIDVFPSGAEQGA